MSAKTITITNPDNGNKYELEFNRMEAVKLEKKGISMQKLVEDGKPLTLIWELFDASFNMHSARITKNEKQKLFDLVNNKFVEKLIDMYADSVNSLLGDEPKAENENEGNALWEANW